MKRRLIGAGVLLTLCLSLCACATKQENLPLQGKKTEYSQTIASATTTFGDVKLSESNGNHTVSNQTARLEFGKETEGLKALTSLQTGETLLQNTVITQLTGSDGKVGQISGGKDTTLQDHYCVSHHRTDAALRFSADADKSTVLKEFDLTKEEVQADFSTLNHDVTVSESQTGLFLTSKGKNRSQFGARDLNLDLGTADHYYLSVTLKVENLSGLKCYFSTDTIPLTEDTLLGTLNLKETKQSEFITLTAEIDNKLWNGTLQTLLFRLPEGETGTLELSRIAILTANDPLEEGVAQSQWTVYADRIYFSQSIDSQKNYTSISTVILVNAAKCKEVIETQNAVGLKLIDGSLLGFIRPLTGGTLQIKKTDDEIRLILHWDLSGENPSIALRIYLNYTQDTKELEQVAQEERTPLDSENITLNGGEFEGYDPKTGSYRLKSTEKNVSLSVKKDNRTLYFSLSPAENTLWSLFDKKGNRLPIVVGTTFPLCPEKKNLTVQLMSEPAPEKIEIPPFFADFGLLKQSETAVFTGPCTQNITEYVANDGSYSVTLTTTRLKDGLATVYDMEYRFLARTQVEDLRENFPIFAFESTDGFDEYFYLDAENQTATVSAGSEEISYLGSMPYVGVSCDGKTSGWLIPKGQMTLDGVSSTAHLCLKYHESEDKSNQLYLSFDESETAFSKGDTLTAQVIRWDDGAVSEDTLKTLRNTGNLRLIQTEHKDAKTVTATGMEDTVLLKIEGFDRYVFPKITVNGEIFTPEYRVYVDENGSYGFAFAVPKGTEVFFKK